MIKRRYPKHLGTRLIGDPGAACIIAMPVVEGEVVERVALDGMALTKDAESNVDQPPFFSWCGIYTPQSFSQGSWVNTVGGLDELLKDAENENAGDHWGGEVDTSAGTGNLDVGIGFAGGAKVIFRRNVWGRPMPVGLDAEGNADARFFDDFRTVLHLNARVSAPGMLLFGARMWDASAQTTFGVFNLDNTVKVDDFIRGYRQPWSVETDAAGGVSELFYGGDNYIEADSVKETDRRHYLTARASIRLRD